MKYFKSCCFKIVIKNLLWKRKTKGGKLLHPVMQQKVGKEIRFAKKWLCQDYQFPLSSSLFKPSLFPTFSPGQKNAIGNI